MRLEAIDTHLVVALHALLQEANVTRAARRVGVTQPSMSHSLAKLRAHFGDPLLVPAGRALALTERARALATPVAEAIERLERVFVQAPRFDPRRATRTFRLAATDNLALYVLPALSERMASEAPRVDVRCEPLGADWRERLRRGELDAKLGRAEPTADDLRSTPLAREKLVCVVRRGHPAARGRLSVVRYAALDHLLVAPRGGDTGVVDRALAARGLRRRVAMTVPHFLVAPFVIARSDWILTVSARVAAALAPALDLVTFACPVRVDEYGLALTWAASADSDEGHRWLRRAIARAVASSASA